MFIYDPTAHCNVLLAECTSLPVRNGFCPVRHLNGWFVLHYPTGKTFPLDAYPEVAERVRQRREENHCVVG
jgi:hypothetical protein